MSLPIDLPAGVVSIYGMGTKVSASGVEITDQASPIRFGSIYQIWDGGNGLIVTVGDNVMFNNNNVVGRVTYQTIPYTLVPARLVTKDNPPL